MCEDMFLKGDHFAVKGSMLGSMAFHHNSTGYRIVGRKGEWRCYNGYICELGIGISVAHWMYGSATLVVYLWVKCNFCGIKFGVGEGDNHSSLESHYTKRLD